MLQSKPPSTLIRSTGRHRQTDPAYGLCFVENAFIIGIIIFLRHI